MPSFRSSARRIAHLACHAGLFLFPLSVAALAEPPGPAADLPEVRVSANAGGSGYLAVDAAGATRTDTPLREVPQSVRVVTSQLIDDLGATRLADTVDYVSGVARLNDFGETWDNYAIRGFSSTEMGYLVNGFPGARGYNPMRDAATVERPRGGALWQQRTGRHHQYCHEEAKVHGGDPFGKSFRPNSGVDEAGNAFDPQYAGSVEAGLKWQSQEERLGATLAFFDIRKHNVLTRSPANPNFNIAAGQAASRGLELDAFGNLDEHWRISGSFSLVNARVTEDNTIAPGTRLTNIPRISASLLVIGKMPCQSSAAAMASALALSTSAIDPETPPTRIRCRPTPR